MIRTQRYRQIAVGTPLGEDVVLLKGMRGTESLGRLFEYNLDLLSEDPNIGFDDIVGQNVSVRVQRSGGEEPAHFNGFVSSFAFVEPMHGLSRYRATLVPWLWFLTQTSDCRIFQNLTVPDVIKKVFRERGFTDFEDRMSGKYRAWEYCVQYRETDFNFVSRLMEQEGIYYFFRHNESKHTLVLADSAAAHEPIAGYETIPYRPRTTSIRQEEYLSKWAVEQNVQPGAYAHNDFDFKNPTKPMLAASKSTHRNPLPGSEIYDYPGKYVEVADGEACARRRIEELHAHTKSPRARERCAASPSATRSRWPAIRGRACARGTW